MQQTQQNDLPLYSVKCLRRTRAHTNIDCIKICPMDQQIWAFAFYQQHPQFRGGLQIVSTQSILSGQGVKFGEGDGYAEMGSIMHAEWLDSRPYAYNKQKIQQYYILSAARCDEAIISAYVAAVGKLTITKRILLQTGVFCLYCDWRVVSAQQDKELSVMAVVSTNQQSVFCFPATLAQQDLLIGQICDYNKHEYAVWACKIVPYPAAPLLLALGDEVNSLYLYNLQTKSLVAKNKTAHTQGICQIVWMNQQTLISGSFDGSIAIISIANFSQTLKRVQLGGTIWRIINFGTPTQKEGWENLLICNSSQKTFQIVRKDPLKQIWNSGKEHQSLAYAAQSNGKYIITASFYDQEVRVWSTGL